MASIARACGGVVAVAADRPDADRQDAWGSLGPRALTAAARGHGVYRLALPPEVLCAVHWDDAAWIRDP